MSTPTNIQTVGALAVACTVLFALLISRAEESGWLPPRWAIPWLLLGLKIRILFYKFRMAILIKLHFILSLRLGRRQVYQHLVYFWWCVNPFSAHRIKANK